MKSIRQFKRRHTRRPFLCFSALLAAPLLLTGAAQAQTNQPPAQTNGRPVDELPPQVITASPLPSSLFDLAQPATVVSDERLMQNLTATIGDTLMQEVGINASSYGPNASRPVIRGLDGDRVRVLQNGVSSLDVSATSVDHAVAFDPLTVNKIEVVRGPAALLYGPNAIGGVVNVLDNRIPDARIDKPITGRIEGRASSPDSGLNGAGVIEGGYKGFNFHLDGFTRASQNLRIPGFARSERLRAADPLPIGDPEPQDRLINSSAKSDGGSVGVSYVWEKGYAGASVQGFNNYYGTVAEEDVTIGMNQRRLDLAGAFYDPFDGFQSIKWKFGGSDYKHTEFEGPDPGTVFKQDALNARLEALHRPVGRIEGAIGYEGRHDDLRISGDEAFLPFSDTLVNSGFIFEEIKWEKVRLQFGGRLDATRINTEASTGFGPGQSQDFITGSGSAGVVYSPNDGYSAAVNFAYTQRPPSAAELFANGPHAATGTFEVGDATLSPERAYGVDLTLRKQSGSVTGTATFFYTRFDDFIALVPRGATDPGSGLPIYDYRAQPAEFIGVEGSIKFHLIEQQDHRLHLELKTDYVRATNTDTDEPLPRISPWRYGAELGYEAGRCSLSVSVMRNHAQNRNASFELPTDGFTMVNAALSWRVIEGRTNWDLLVRGTNLLNEEARLSTSFLKDIAPLGARGASVALRASF